MYTWCPWSLVRNWSLSPASHSSPTWRCWTYAFLFFTVIIGNGPLAPFQQLVCVKLTNYSYTGGEVFRRQRLIFYAWQCPIAINQVYNLVPRNVGIWRRNLAFFFFWLKPYRSALDKREEESLWRMYTVFIEGYLVLKNPKLSPEPWKLVG